MVLQRQVAGQRKRLLSELFVFLFLLFENLFRLSKLFLMFFQLSLKSFVGFAKLSILFRQFFGPSRLRIARSKEISRSFIPGSLVLADTGRTDRFLKRDSWLLRSFAWLSRKQTNTSARSSLAIQILPKTPKPKHFHHPTFTLGCCKCFWLGFLLPGVVGFFVGGGSFGGEGGAEVFFCPLF